MLYLISPNLHNEIRDRESQENKHKKLTYGSKIDKASKVKERRKWVNYYIAHRFVRKYVRYFKVYTI